MNFALARVVQLEGPFEVGVAKTAKSGFQPASLR